MWQPSMYDGVKFIDPFARCVLDPQYYPEGHPRAGYSILKKPDDSCSQYKLIQTRNFVKRHEASKKAQVNRQMAVADGNDETIEEQMARWYEENKAQYVMVHDGEEGRQDAVGGNDAGDFIKARLEEAATSEEREILRICFQPANNARLDPLFLHQCEDFWRFKDDPEFGCYLEQGCGKSAINLRIAAYKFLHKKIDALLVVAPNDVHKQWAIEQIPLWLPPEIPRELQCFGGRGGARDTYPFNRAEYLHIVCVNIDTFSTPAKWKDIAEWAKSKSTMIILDEATCIKNPKTKRSERMLYEFNDVVRRRTQIISSTRKTISRSALTGTPATNGTCDLWSLKEFLRPNYFNRNWYSFRNRYAMLATITTAYGSTQIMLTKDIWDAVKGCDTYEKAYMLFGVSSDTYETIQMQERFMGAYKHEEELKNLIAPISSFRTLKDCVDMPPQVYHRKQVTMSSEQQKAYKDMERELLAMYGGATTTAANKLSALIRLQQISSGFIVQGQLKAFDPEDETTWWGGENEPDIEPGDVMWLGNTNPKLDQLFRDVEESSRPCIIITRFSAEAARIYDELSKQFSTMLYTGWKKTGTIEEFKDGKYEILVANIRCISRGFNLQNACQMFFYSNTFSLEDRLQVEARIFRIGQRSPCAYTDYINENTIDLKVVGALRQKRALLDYIRGQSLVSFVEDEDEVTAMEAA
jgi:SNF2 family DNA or RNA helicase